LCSIATSTKDVATSIGNKGVGFKSVFSISHSATVYTNGLIKPQNETMPINFTIKDEFNDANELVRLELADVCTKLQSVQNEKKTWGIPGYYFPIYIENTPKRISDLFNNGFVTVIAVPIEESNKELVCKRIHEIQKFQFNFICEKESFKNKNININFSIDGNEINTTEANNSKTIISRIVSKNTIALARKAGINVSEDSKVSVCFRAKDQIESGPGYIYNFMPTEKMSFLPHVDLNADFQTSVDRKNINLNNKDDEPIGQYNYALMRECLELYRDSLLNNETLPNDLFSWQNVQITNQWLDEQEKRLLREIFNESSIRFSKFATDLLQNRLTLDTTREEYNIYYLFILKCIEQFRAYGDWKDKYRGVAKEVGERINKSGVKFLPDCPCNSSSEILFRREESSITLPTSIPLEITSFVIEGSEYDTPLRKGLGINEFDNVNEVFKLFKQCEQNGKYGNSAALQEDEQINIIASIGKLMSISKKEYADLNSAWRYGALIYAILQDKPENSSKIRASFALSTLFFKTKKGKYKPSQLLSKSDIDEQFLSSIEAQLPETININKLLLMTGVSLSKKYCYFDKRMYDNIGEGLDFIPTLLSNKNSSCKEMLKFVRINSDNGSFSPAIINENYSFFRNIQRTASNKKELSSLHVGNYDEMPSEYGNILKKRLQDICKIISKSDSYNKSELFRFYQKYFKQMYHHNIAMIKEGSEIQIVNKDENYIIVSDRIILNADEFKRAVLCYVPGRNWAEELEDAKSRFRDVAIHIDTDCSEDTHLPLSVGEKLNDRIIAQILLKVSRSKITDRDYEEDIEQRNRIFSLCHNIIIKECDNIVGHCNIEGECIKINELPYLLDEGTLYVEVTKDDEKSKNNVSQALSFLLFSTSILSDIIELVLFSNCWVDEGALNNILKTPTYEDKKYDFSNPELNDLTNSKIHSKREINWDNIDDYEHININQTIKIDSVKGYTQKSVSDSINGLKTAVTPQMEITGMSGEMIVVKAIVKSFMTEYPADKRKTAIEKINIYLQNQGFKPIELMDNQNFDSINDLAPLLWYTLKNKYAHFDVVTIENDTVKLIEIKTTEGNNLFRLSKTEAKVAMGRLDNYCLYRVNKQTHTIINYGNPFHEQLILKTNSGLMIKASGYEVITGMDN